MILKKFLWWASFPLLVLIIPQALHVKRTTLRLPEANGLRKHHPENAAFKFFHVGESTVAGVGVNNIQDGLTAQLATQFSHKLQKPIAWQLYGVNGINISELNASLSEKIPHDDYHLAFVTLGVNDTTKFTSLRKWRDQLTQTVKIIQRSPDVPVIFTQVPPMAQFPALPAPLKYLLGLRAHLLDLELKRFCKQASNVYYVGSELKVAEEMMAEDGYHPSALGYRNWAAQLLPQLEKIIKN